MDTAPMRVGERERPAPRPPGAGRRGPLPWRMKDGELKLLERLGVAGCTQEQAAAALGRDVDTLDAAVRRQLGDKLSDCLAVNRRVGESALLVKAHSLAVSGNAAMLKLALKSRLGWVERDRAPNDAISSEPVLRQSIIVGDKEIIF